MTLTYKTAVLKIQDDHKPVASEMILQLLHKKYLMMKKVYVWPRANKRKKKNGKT